MENNVNLGWEPEEKKISLMPANDQQIEDTENTIQEDEETLPEDDDVEERGLEDDEVEEPWKENEEIEEPWIEEEVVEEPGKANGDEDEMDTEEDGADTI